MVHFVWSTIFSNMAYRDSVVYCVLSVCVADEQTGYCAMRLN